MPKNNSRRLPNVSGIVFAMMAGLFLLALGVSGSELRRFKFIDSVQEMIGSPIGNSVIQSGSSSILLPNSSTVVVDFAGFTGTGFQSIPASGQLDSDDWAVTGWTDGTLAFGGTQTTGDFARGQANSNIITGGMYAYTGSPHSAANPALMIQPGGGDFAPGTLTLRLQNTGTANITRLDIAYDLFVRNDQARSNSFNFSHSSDNSTYSTVPALDFVSPTTAGDVSWAQVGTSPSRSTSITGLNIPVNGFYYIRWSGADVGGAGSRDEFGLDNITISPTFVTPSVTLSTVALSFDTITVGANSAEQNKAIAGSNLIANILCSAPAEFEVSSNGTIWGTTATFAPSSGTVSGATLHTRFSPISAGAKSGSVSCASDGATSQQFDVGGTGALPQFGLSVTKSGSGSGTVTSSPTGINCGAACSANFDSGTVVTLTATSHSNSIFNGWSGGGCTGTGTCVVTMNAAANVTANFSISNPVANADTVDGSVGTSPYTFDPRVNDTTDAGETLTVTGATAGSGGTVVFTSSSVTFTPTNPNTPATYNLNYTISDGNGGTAGSTITLTVFDPPSVGTPTASGVTTSSATLSGTVTNGSLPSTIAARFRYSTTNPTTCNDTFGTRAPGTGSSNIVSGAFSETISGLAPGTQYFYCAIASNKGGLAVSPVQSFTTAAPTITLDTTSLTFGSILVGEHSVGQSKAISGTNLTTDIVCNAPAEFEVSADGTSWGTGATFIQSGGAASGTIHTRFSPTSAGAKSGSVSCTSTGATTQSFGVSGTANNPQPGTVGLSSDTYTTNETNADYTVSIPVQRTGGSDGAVSVTYLVTDGTATVGSDYTLTPATGTLTWANNDATDKFIDITVKGEKISEPNETVNIALSNLTVGATAGTTNAVLTINNDDNSPVAQNVNTSTNQNATVTVTMTATDADGDGLTFSTGTAVNGTLANAGSPNCVSGNCTQTIDFIPTNGYSGVASFTYTASDGANTSNTATVSINVIAPPIVNLEVSANAATATEAPQTVVTVTARSNIAVTGDQTVDLGVSGTGITAGDYSLSGASITIPGGATSGSVTFTVTDDSIYEGAETAILTISNPSTGIVLGPTTSQNISIADSDAMPTLSVDSVSSSEGNSGTTNFVFTVTKTGEAQVPVSALFATADLSATGGTCGNAGVDYGTISGNFTFNPGDASTKTITVGVCGDTLFEENETFNLSLSSPTNATIMSGTGAGTIVNDDCNSAPVVTSNADSGLGSLRQAVIDACPGSTINFSGVTSPILLSSGQITVNKNLTIQGPGATSLTVENTQMQSPTSRVFVISGSVAVTINDLTMSGGDLSAGNDGGAIYNSLGSTLALNRDVIADNYAPRGGGILSVGNLILNSTTVTGNYASFGGGVAQFGATAIIDRSTISNNQVTNNGGGVLFTGGANHVISNTMISGNSSNSCGGLQIDTGGSIKVLNSTISGNQASSASAGGCVFGSQAAFVNATVYNNSNAGVNISDPGSELKLLNTIIAGNGSTRDLTPVDSGVVTTLGNNLIGNNYTVESTFPTGTNANGDRVGDSTTPLDPMLGLLANNGGPTLTHALASTSPAIDAGNNCVFDNTCTPTVGFSLTTDQRGAGYARKIDGNVDMISTVDIGAYEAPSPGALNQTISVTTAAPASAGYGSIFNVGATASSTLPVAITTAGVCSVASGGSGTASIQMTASSGTCTVRYDQEGNAAYNAAPQVTNNTTATKTVLTVTASSHTVSFGSAAPVVSPSYSGFAFGETPTSLTTQPTCGTDYSVGSPVSGSPYQTSCAGGVSANYVFNYVNGTVTVNRAAQVINVTPPGAPASAVFGTSFTVSASGGASGNDVLISGSGGCSGIGYNSVSITMTSGTTACVVHYNQAGNANYADAAEVTSSTTASKASQSISVTTSAPATAVYGSSFQVTATGGGSGNPVTIVGSGSCAGTGNNSAVITMTSGVGPCTVTYNQAGNDNYYDAATVSSNNTAASKAASTTTVTCPTSVAYTGSPVTPCSATVTGPNSTVLSASPTYTDNTGPGTATASYTFAGDDNHTGSSGSATFEITQCPIVSVPTLIVSRNGAVETVPISTTTLTGLGVISTDLIFAYDPSVVTPNPDPAHPELHGVSLGAVGLSNGGSRVLTVSNDTVAGTLTISIFGTTEMQGAGPIVNVSFVVNGGAGSSTALQMNNFRFNGGNLCSSSNNGMLTVTGKVAGKISYENVPFPTAPAPTPTPQPVPVVNLTATGGSPTITGSTNASGEYSLSGFGLGSYTVTPAKSAYACGSLRGIDVFDAQLVAQHVVGLVTLSAAQQRAAKVSPGTAAISSFDAGLIAQCFVGINNPSVNSTGTWRFTSVNKFYADTSVDRLSEDYVAMLMGDVSGSWTPVLPAFAEVLEQGTKASENAVRASLPTTNVMPNGSVSVPFRIDNLRGRGFASYQFDVTFDPLVVTPADVVADLAGTLGEGMTVVSHSPEAGLLKVGVFGTMPVTTDGVFVNLRFTARGGVGMTTPLTIRGFAIGDGRTETTTVNGQLTVSTAATSATVRGRVLSADGRGVRNAQVTATTATGRGISVTTGPLGAYEMNGLTLGETYTIKVTSRRFTFAPRTVTLVDGVTNDIDISAQR